MLEQSNESQEKTPAETILILEKESHVQWTVKTLLENEKYIVFAVNSIERAMQNISEFQVSGFITEYRIGQCRTLEIIKSLKSAFPETYVMMITDNDLKDTEYEEIMSAGVDDYFLKPIPVSKILLHLKKGLKQRNICVEKKKMEAELATATKTKRKEREKHQSLHP
jgi:DNA-binding NtrC family response regulator